MTQEEFDEMFELSVNGFFSPHNPSQSVKTVTPHALTDEEIDAIGIETREMVLNAFRPAKVAV